MRGAFKNLNLYKVSVNVKATVMNYADVMMIVMNHRRHFWDRELEEIDSLLLLM